MESDTRLQKKSRKIQIAILYGTYKNALQINYSTIFI